MARNTNLKDASVALGEYLCDSDLGHDYDVFGILSNVVDETSDPIRADRLDRVEQEEGTGIVDVVGDIASQCEDEFGYLAFALAQVIDGVLVRSTNLGTSDNVQVEHLFIDVSAASRDRLLVAFDPDAVEVLVAEDIEDCLQVLVELVDGLVFDAVDLCPQVHILVTNPVTGRFKAFSTIQLCFNLVYLRFDAFEFIPKWTECDLTTEGPYELLGEKLFRSTSETDGPPILFGRELDGPVQAE